MKKNNNGYTLIELIISLSLGLLISAASMQFFVASSSSYRLQQGIARVMENGRFAIEFSARDIRNAGYLGCMTGKDLKQNINYFNLLNGSDELMYHYDEPVSGYDNVSAKIDGIDAVAGTDVLVVRAPYGDPVYVADTGSTGDFIAVKESSIVKEACASNGDKLSGICKGDLLLLSNCSRAVIFQETDISRSNNAGIDEIYHTGSGEPGNAIVSWDTLSALSTVNPGEEVIKIRTSIFYIGIGDITKRPGLFVKRGDEEPVELIQDVDAMEITYGIDTDGDGIANTFVSADQVNDWKKVGAVSLKFLVQSPEENILTTQESIFFNGIDVDVSDRRYRRQFSTVIALRNNSPL